MDLVFKVISSPASASAFTVASAPTPTSSSYFASSTFSAFPAAAAAPTPTPQYAELMALPDPLLDMMDEFGEARTEAGQMGQTCEERSGTESGTCRFNCLPQVLRL